jgi:hypothetical protein
MQSVLPQQLLTDAGADLQSAPLLGCNPCPIITNPLARICDPCPIITNPLTRAGSGIAQLAKTVCGCLFRRPFFGSFFGRTKKERNKLSLKPILNKQG